MNQSSDKEICALRDRIKRLEEHCRSWEGLFYEKRRKLEALEAELKLTIEGRDEWKDKYEKVYSKLLKLQCNLGEDSKRMIPRFTDEEDK